MFRYTTVFEYTILPYEDTKGVPVVEKLKHEMLAHDNYAYIFLDEYEISCMESYRQRHFLHESLIYGFDDDQQVFYAVAFDKSGHFSKLAYGYEEVRAGYVSGFSCESEVIEDTIGITFFKIRPNFSHRLYLPNVFQALQEYINGTVPKNIRDIHQNTLFIQYIQDATALFGMDAVRRTSEILRELDPREYKQGDFRRVHFLYEHSNMLLERFEYYQRYAEPNQSSDYKRWTEEYAGIVAQYQTVRMMFLKSNMLRDMQRESDTNKLVDLRDKMADRLMDLYREEKRVVSRLLNCMCQWDSGDRYQMNEFSINLSSRMSVHTAERATGLQFDLLFSQPTGVHGIYFDCVADIALSLDDNFYDRFYYSRLSNVGRRGLTLDKLVQKITVQTNRSVTIDALDFRVYGGNVLLGRKITASSVWVEEEHPNQPGLPRLPWKAVNSDPEQYWRACAQKERYDGKDWIEADLDQGAPIHTIVIGELDYSPRIKTYRIKIQTSDQSVVLLDSCQFERGKPNMMRIEPVVAVRLTIEFLECEADSQGYCEPLLNRLEAY